MLAGLFGTCQKPLYTTTDMLQQASFAMAQYLALRLIRSAIGQSSRAVRSEKLAANQAFRGRMRWKSLFSEALSRTKSTGLDDSEAIKDKVL